jgi:D-glycero-alpha-D-manno-heptose-7-phosphate kinase
MIIVRSPLRITLGGGGTDVPSYSDKYGGFCISAAINKHVFCSVTKPFKRGIYLKYSELEEVDSINRVKHPIIREALRLLEVEPCIEITALADVPSGTGLGSSGSFTTALLKALYLFQKRSVSQDKLAETAFHIEAEILGEPAGRQDQYASAFGGITCFEFCDGVADVFPLNVSPRTLDDLSKNLLLFFTGYSRSAYKVLKEQDEATRSYDSDMVNHLHEIKRLGILSMVALENGKTGLWGDYLHTHWLNKRKRSVAMSNDKVDEWYLGARMNGARGGKLVGAGGGGFFLFYCDDPDKVREYMSNVGLQELKYQWDFEGTKVLIS